MASRHLLSEVEFCCPVCHDTFRDPVILSCGHSFCAGCLQRWWRGNPAQECPVCKRRSSRGDPPRNLALRNLCEAYLRERSASSMGEDGEGGVCSLHAEKLRLFCLDHQQLVCLVCRDSEQHAGHAFRPVDEAARPRKAEAQCSLEALRGRLQLLKKARGERLQAAERVKAQARDAERQIGEDVRERCRALREEEEARVGAVREDERSKSRAVRLEIEALSEQIAAVSDSIRVVERELRAANGSFLRTHKAAMARALPQDTQLADLGTHKPSPVEKVLHNLTSASRACSLISGLRKYTCRLTLDPNTVNRLVSLSEDSRRVMWLREQQAYPDHPDRFTSFPQVLCCEGLIGRSYWEVDWEGLVVIGAAYREIGRRGDGNDCCLGWNDKSWALECSSKGFTAWHNNLETAVALAPSPGTPNRLGVYVDWPAGSLSFYEVLSSDTVTHIHTFYCSFTQELHAGFELGWYGSSATLMQVEEVE